MKLINTDTNEVKNEEVKDKMIKVRKNILMCFNSDATGCGTIRMWQPMSYIWSVFGRQQSLLPMLSPLFLKQPDLLLHCRSITFQRQMSPQHVTILKEYRSMQAKFKYKLLYEIDDNLWGNNETQGGDKFNGIPSYNFASEVVNDVMKQSAIEMMQNVDKVVTSTNYLKDIIVNKLNIKTPVEVLQNTVPIYMYGRFDREAESKDIVKPRVLFNESPTHYSNKHQMLGDLASGEWVQWITKAVKNDEIEFITMGGCPFCFESIRDKIKVIEWTYSLQYPQHLKSLKAHFIISPLVPNEFNSAKSNIKFLESCAVGAIAIGTVFKDRVSPYDENMVTAHEDITVAEIDSMIKTYCDKDKFNETVQKQYSYLEDNGYFTESASYIQKLLSIF